MTTHPYRTTCPIGRNMSQPCPCHVPIETRDPNDAVRACGVCLAEWEERAALIADGCRLTQPQAEAEATRQLREAVGAAENRQGRLF